MTTRFTRRAQVAYFAAWVPLGGLLFVVLINSGLAWVHALVIALLYCVPLSMIGHASRWMCRALPLRPSRITETAPALLIATALTGLLAGGLFHTVAGQLDWLAVDNLNGTSLTIAALGSLYFGLSLAWHYLLIAQGDIERARADSSEARMLSREAELRALRAQLNPHFLFNSLNSIAALTAIDPARTRDMTLALSEFLRTSLRMGNLERVSLADELALAQNYLDIEQIRFSDRMTVALDTDPECLNISVPPLILQPLVENAVKHGVAILTRKSAIEITVRGDTNYVCVTVRNETAPNHHPAKGTGMGIGATRERMRLFTDQEDALQLDQEDHSFTATLRIPRFPAKRRTA